MKKTLPHDCTCSGIPSRCPACLIRYAVHFRRLHPYSLSVAMIRRRLPELGHREAALLVELSRHFEDAA